MKILIVDDKEDNIYLLESLLSGNGFEVARAKNGISAMEVLGENECDLIISDILMPGMDGFEFCRRVKRDDKLKSIPFIFYTATYTDKKDEELALSLGAVRFIIKPEKPDVFLGIVKDILENFKTVSVDSQMTQVGDETEIYKLYNERLIKKLEKKMLELEKEKFERTEVEKENKMLVQAIKSIGECVSIADANDNILFVNEAFQKTYGYTSEEIIGNSFSMFRSVHTPMEQFEEIYNETLKGGWKGEILQMKKDGTEFPVLLSTSVVLDQLGKPIALIGVANDITDRKKLEDQFRQSQKMEAVGRLAGGVAHDFNNMLTVINGYAELLKMRLDEKDPLYKFINDISKAGDRAEMITRQLLAFSRKQVLSPVILDITKTIKELDKMLNRLIQEDIELKTHLDPNTGKIKADPGQIEQVILNLAINARDAMPNGGKLSIETKTVQFNEPFTWEKSEILPGEYVLIAIQDSGEGMSKEIVEHIYEPFFTTKKEGKGTGLGLSTVYGIVKQSGGFINVYSEPGIGSTFKIYFPCAKGTVTNIERVNIEYSSLKGTETILIAEDDDDILGFASEVLRLYGYNVLEASNGGMALLKCENYKDTIHLLLTDIVMPEMSGAELVERLHALHTEMKVLYMSGYSDDAVLNSGILNQGTNFIQKPFSPSALLERVRNILDEKHAVPVPA